MKLRPVGHRVLVEMDDVDSEKISDGGIILANQGGVREKFAMEKGTVVEIGPQAFKDFGDGEPWCIPGDKVKIVRYSGNDDQELFEQTGRVYRIVNDEDIYAIVEE